MVKALVRNEEGYAKNESNNQGVKIYLQKQYNFELHPALEIAEIRDGSPAAIVGLREGDVILQVNKKNVHNYSLQQVSEMMNERVGKTVYVTVERSGSTLKFNFKLQKVL